MTKARLGTYFATGGTKITVLPIVPLLYSCNRLGLNTALALDNEFATENFIVIP